MFLIYALEDKILLKNDELNTNLSYQEVVLKNIREKYIGKILLGHGIVVTVKKLVIKQSLIVEIEGILNIEYDADIILFKPVKGDLLYGKIISSDETGLIVDCQLLKVFVPRIYLMKPADFDLVDRVWFWCYKDVKLYYDIGEDIKCLVIELNFKSKNEVATLANCENFTSQDKLEYNFENIMEVICSVSQEGLGPIKWWA